MLIYSINGNCINNYINSNPNSYGGRNVLSPNPLPPTAITVQSWLDYNENGIKDGIDNGLDGVSVRLYNENNNLIASGITLNNGQFVFNNVANGTYRIKLGSFTGLNYTYMDVGSDDNLDSDIDYGGYSEFFIIDNSSNNVLITGGFRGNLQVVLGNSQNICKGSQITLNATTFFGKAPFTYQWNNNLPNQSSVDVSPDSLTVYHVTVTDSWGFQAESDVIVRVKDGIGEERHTVIDDFNHGSGGSQFRLEVNPSNPGSIQGVDFANTGIIGNYRTVDLTYSSGTQSAAVVIDYNSGYFSHSNEDGTISKAELYYDNNGVGLHQDISAFDYIKINDIGLDQGELNVKISIVDFDNNTATITKRLPGLGNSTIYNKEIRLADFNNINNINLNDIKEFYFYFTSKDKSIDYRLGDLWICEFTNCNVKAEPVLAEICQGDSVDINAIAECVNIVSYSWDNGVGYGAKHKVSPDATTVYHVTATDAYGCTSTDSVKVIVHPNPSINLPSDLNMCKGDTLDISVDVLSGLAPYNYIWSNGDTSKSISVSPLANTSYEVTVIDANGCSSVTKKVDVEVYPTPSVILTSTIADCAESNGSATASPSGGTPPYDFLWSNSGTNSTITGISAGDYIVTVTDVNGCHIVDTVIVAEKNCGLLGDFVWEDDNANGVQDSGEKGIENVKVELYDKDKILLKTEFTDFDGVYYFHGLHEGDYYVKFIKPSEYEYTSRDIGLDDKDNDPDSITGFTKLISLAKYEKDSTIDAGMYKLASIGDTVWIDANGNGEQDSDEDGLGNVTVKLLDCNDNELASMVTDQNGSYLFDDLKPGDYKIKFVLPVGYKFTEKNAVSDITTDSDANLTSGLTNCEFLSSGENNYSYDAGVFIPASLGDKVWLDKNANGVQDPNEVGVENISVILNSCDGTPIDTVLTDSNGNYLFDDLTPGEYKISIIKPVEYQFADSNIGNDSFDSDINSDGFSICESLKSGENNLTYDIGLYQLASIGDLVWLDNNGNGIQDSSELGIEGVSVELQSCSGAVISSNETDALGKYLFDDLKPGQYRMKFILPNGYHFTNRDIGLDSSDSDANSTGHTICEELESGESNLTYDAGVYQYAKIGDRVWLDDNSDGKQNAGEKGKENVKVDLMDCQGNIMETTYTDPNGNYLFDDLTPGNYKIKFHTLSEYSFTELNASVDSLDSDANQSTGETICEDLSSGEENLTFDAGLVYYGSLGDFVWDDKNGDGVQQENEPVVPNVEIRLYYWQSNSFVYKGSSYTDSQGKYLFDKLIAGSYYIKVVLPNGYDVTFANKGNDDTKDCDIDHTNGENSSKVISLSPGQDDMTWDIGLYKCASIGDLIWRDYLQNDVYDDTEGGIDGVLVKLYRKDGNNWIYWDNTYSTYKPSSVCGSGYWSFCVAPGVYFVEFAGMTNTDYNHVAPNTGNDDTIDSDVDDSHGMNTTGNYILYSGDSITHVYAGYYKEYSVFGKAWIDENEDGIRTSDEDVLENIEVQLFSDLGYLTSVQTDNNGEYTFGALDPGDYFVKFELPSGYYFTAPNQGDSDFDSDVTGNNGNNTTNWFSIEEGSNIDAGFVPYTGANGFYVSPNPTSSKINIEFRGENDENISLYIVDANGQIIYRANKIRTLKNEFYKKEINIERLPSGLYQFIIKTNKKVLKTKFLKINK